ncbi:hypothetical protein F5B21DRAFT_331023 [Xylaria acuta]|nr:hypothetical protein F5B21DRAFT_331023 [Xylaria acuta]
MCIRRLWSVARRRVLSAVLLTEHVLPHMVLLTSHGTRFGGRANIDIRRHLIYGSKRTRGGVNRTGGCWHSRNWNGLVQSSMSSRLEIVTAFDSGVVWRIGQSQYTREHNASRTWKVSRTATSALSVDRASYLYHDVMVSQHHADLFLSFPEQLHDTSQTSRQETLGVECQPIHF